MKKIMIAVILLTAGALSANAQFEKGSIMVGASSGISLLSSGSGSGLGSIGFSNVTNTDDYQGDVYTEEYKSSNFSVLPKGGFFVIDNFAVGAGLNYSRSKEEYESDGWFKDYTTIFSFEPFLRYYIPLNTVTPFFEVSAGFGGVYYKSESEGNPDPISDKAPLSTFAGGVGVSFPIGMNASFDVLTGYTHLKAVQEDEFLTTTTKVGSFGINLGFRVFFGGYGFSGDDSY